MFLKPTLQNLYIFTYCSVIPGTNFAILLKSSVLKLSQKVGFSLSVPNWPNTIYLCPHCPELGLVFGFGFWGFFWFFFLFSLKREFVRKTIE